MRRLIVLILIICLPLTACHRMVEEDNHLRVYASFYPIYLIAAEIVSGAPDLTAGCLTQPQDGCLRAYTLSDWDRATLCDADVLVMGGRGLESFAGETANAPYAVITAAEGATLIRDGETAPQDDEASHLTGENPWLFLDPDGALYMARSVYNAMTALDPGSQALYKKNFQAFSADIARLKETIKAATQGARGLKVALLHEGLEYFARALDLEVAARIDREPASTLDDTTLKQAIEIIKASGAQAVLIETQAPQCLTDELRAAGLRIARIDTLTRQDASLSYAQRMENNARAAAALAA